ncbi:hypothetical protein WDW37_12995, partial [Bdellovibrionota bacterium FG-1]
AFPTRTLPRGILIASYIALLVGVIMLDDRGAPTTQMAPMTEQERLEIGATPAGMRAFNRALGRMNGVSESIARQIADQRITDSDVALRLIHDQWAEAAHDGVISELAYSTLVLRAEQFNRRLESVEARAL